jgi:hypothetical protein
MNPEEMMAQDPAQLQQPDQHNKTVRAMYQPMT